MSAPTPLARRDRIRNRIAAFVLLILVWNLLWDRITLTTLLSGVVVATVVLMLFPLPPVTFAGRIRPLGVLRFLLRFFRDLVVASVQIAWLAFRIGRVPRSAIIAVRLRVHSDLNLTLVAEAISLVPGSLIVEADRATGTLYVHVLGVADRQAVERFRRNALAVEARLIRAIGSAHELRQVNEPLPSGGSTRGRTPPDAER